MRFLRKYWYIWFGIYIFPFFAFHSLSRVQKEDEKNKVTFFNSKSLVRKVYGNFFFLGIAVVGIPSLIIATSVENSERTFVQSLFLIYLYLSSVLANYLHARWREKHLGHLLKKGDGGGSPE